MANPITFVLGYKTISTDIGVAADIFNICKENGIVYRNQKADQSTVSIECTLIYARRLESLCRKRGISLISVKSHGIPHIFYKYRHRYGLMAALAISVILLILSRLFVWDIRIDGEKRLSEKQILDDLNTCGIHIGSPIKKLDTDVIQNRMIIYSDEVSWISINLIGTVAHIEIREVEPYPEETEKPYAANLVATEDGEIIGFEEVKGEIVVKIGDRVRKGDLLVSGIRDSKTQGFTYTCAEGMVFAKTVSSYGISVPLEYQKKERTGKVYTEKYLVFFNKDVKIYSNNRKMPESCDIIDTVKYMNVLSLGELPFGIRTVKHIEYNLQNATRSAEEAIDLAFYRLRSTEEELGVSDILSKQLSGSLVDGAYRLECTTTSVKNIARQIEIELANKK